MRLLTSAVLTALVVVAPVPSSAQASNADRDAVLKVVDEAYVQGVHASPSAEAMRRGFHPGFRMLVLADGKLSAVTLDEWAGRIEKSSAAAASASRPAITREISRVEIEGHAATVRLELYRDGRHTFTDFLSLYRFPDGWKIVGKTFYTHPR